MRVLLVEPFFSGSHRQWAEGFAAHSGHDVELVTHDGAYWRWRMRGGALTLAEAVAASVRRHGRPDVCLVSGMVNLAALLGFARHDLATTPIALYLHENQLTYPDQPGGVAGAEFTMTNWSSMAVADAVFVNSDYHRSTLFAALEPQLAAVPDQGHSHRLASVEERTSVLPVGVDLDDLRATDPASTPDAAGQQGPLIVWNHRWDHDKAPGRLFAVLRRMARQGVAFRIALAGENTRTDPQEFDAFTRDLADRVAHVGWLERPEYAALLGTADVVVSTADQENFGVAMVEAMAARCVPLLPDRLSYPELIGDQWHDAVLYDDDELEERLTMVLTDVAAARDAVDGLADSMTRFSWDRVAPAYDQALADLARSEGAR